MNYLIYSVFYAVTLAVSFDHGSLNSTYYNSGQLTGTSTLHQSTQLPTSIASSDCSKFMHTTVTVPVCTEYLTETETIQFNTSTTPSQSVSPNNPYQYEIPPYGGIYTTNDESASSSAACSSIGIVASTTTILVEPTTITMTEIITSDISSTYSRSLQTATSSSTTIAEPTCTADILNDSQNCGKCGNICDTGICESGSCTNFQCSVESCGNFNQCGDQSSDCFCFSSTTPPPVKDSSTMDEMTKKSNGFCGKNAICSGLTACASDLDCVAGSSGNICAISTCCPELSADKPGVCLEAQCGNPSQKLRVLSRIRSVKGITAAF